MYIFYQNCIAPDKKKDMQWGPIHEKGLWPINRHMKIIQINAECDVKQYRITSCCGFFFAARSLQFSP